MISFTVPLFVESDSYLFIATLFYRWELPKNINNTARNHGEQINGSMSDCLRSFWQRLKTN